MNDSDRLLDTAMDSYPMAPLPPGFVRRTMSRIQPHAAPRIQFLDVALPMFVALSATATALVLRLSMAWDPLWLSRLELELTVGWWSMAPHGLHPVVTAAVAAATASLVLFPFLLVLDRPRVPVG